MVKKHCWQALLNNQGKMLHLKVLFVTTLVLWSVAENINADGGVKDGVTEDEILVNSTASCYPYLVFITAAGSTRKLLGVGVMVTPNFVLTMSERVKTAASVDVHFNVNDAAQIDAEIPHSTSEKILFHDANELCCPVLIRVTPPFPLGTVIEPDSRRTAAREEAKILSYVGEEDISMPLSEQSVLTADMKDCSSLKDFNPEIHVCLRNKPGTKALDIEFPGSPVVVRGRVTAMFAKFGVSPQDGVAYAWDVTKYTSWVKNNVAE